MATRFSVSLAHAGCDYTGFVVWEERERADARGASGPVVVGLPRGFVSLNSEDGAIEVVCAGCRQTVASAVRVDVPAGNVAADPAVAATEPPAGGAAPGQPAVGAASASAAVAAEHKDAAPATAAGADVALAGGGEGGVTEPAAPGEAPAIAASADRATAETAGAPADPTAEDKVRADIEALFAEAEDVAPIRGDAIPPHLLDKLRHLADRMRQRRE